MEQALAYLGVAIVTILALALIGISFILAKGMAKRVIDDGYTHRMNAELAFQHPQPKTKGNPDDGR